MFYIIIKGTLEFCFFSAECYQKIILSSWNLKMKFLRLIWSNYFVTVRSIKKFYKNNKILNIDFPLNLHTTTTVTTTTQQPQQQLMNEWRNECHLKMKFHTHSSQSLTIERILFCSVNPHKERVSNFRWRLFRGWILRT